MSNKITIALFIPDLGIGGAEKAFIRISNKLINLGYAVDLITFSHNSDLEIFLSPSIKKINFNKRNAFFALIPLIRYIIKSKPKAILSVLDLTNIIAILAKKLSLQKTTVSIYVVNNTSKQERSKIKKFLEKLSLRLIYPLADNIIAIADEVAEDLTNYINLPLEKIKVQYSPILDHNLDDLSSESLSHPWFQNGSPPVILGIGRLVEQKNFLLLIESFTYVSKSIKSNLMIIGDGDQYNLLRDRVYELGLQERVELTGSILNPYPYVKNAAVLAVPSNWDGLSTIMIEAMYLGCPIISTDCISGPREILDNGKYGRLIPVGDKNELAKGLIEILNGNHKIIDKSWLDQFTVETTVYEILNKIGIINQHE